MRHVVVHAGFEILQVLITGRDTLAGDHLRLHVRILLLEIAVTGVVRQTMSTEGSQRDGQHAKQSRQHQA